MGPGNFSSGNLGSRPENAARISQQQKLSSGNAMVQPQVSKTKLTNHDFSENKRIFVPIALLDKIWTKIGSVMFQLGT